MQTDDDTTTEPAIATENCAGCKRGGRCAIHGSPKKRRGAFIAGLGPAAGGDQDEEPLRAPPDPGRFEPAVPLADIRPSPHNHRKTFTGLEELAASMREKGVINPITIRPTNGVHVIGAARGSAAAARVLSETAYELIAGERRYRAARLAGRKDIPAMIRELSDVEVLEIQLIENVQRADVHPLEEADGYRDLLDTHGYTVERIVEKTGKSKAWVYARLKLCDLAAETRELFLSEKLSASVALLIARIPDPKLQTRATREVLCLEPDGEGSVDTRMHDFIDRPTVEVEDDKGGVREEIVPMSVREAAQHIQKNYMLRLELAKFDLADERLLPSAGACTKCIHRTGNQADLFGDVKRADVCTNPPCFGRKTRAAFELAAAAAIANGARVLAEDESKKLFPSPHDPSAVRSGAAYVAPDDPVPWDVRELLPQRERDAAGDVTWGKLLGKKGVGEVERVVAQDGSGAPVELITKAKAVAHLVAAGRLEKPAEKKSSARPTHSSANDEKAKRDHEIVESAFTEVFAATAHVSLAKLPQKNVLELWRWAVATYADITSNGDGAELVGEALGIQKGGYPTRPDIKKALAKVKTVPELQLLLIRFVVAEAMPHRELDADAVAGLKCLGLDWKKWLEARKAAAKKPSAAAAKLTDPCAKCGREFGEHNGKKCPKAKPKAGGKEG